MANVTVTLDDAVLAEARNAADGDGKSLSRFLAELVEADLARRRGERVVAMGAFLDVARAVKLDGAAYTFNRDEIYDEAVSRLERGDLRARSARAGKAGALHGVAERDGADGYAHDQPASVRRSAKRRGKKAPSGD